MYLEQLGTGKGYDSVPERDREQVANDPHSKIARPPEDVVSKLLMRIFHNTPFIYGQHGITGYNYEGLKDQIKWTGLRPKDFVNVLHTMLNRFIKGTQNKV